MRRQIDVLQEMTADELAGLIRARPDLARPRPATLQELSNRCAQVPSVAQAVRNLTAFKLAVVEALCVLPPDPTLDQVAVAVGSSSDDVAAALVALRGLLLALDDNGVAHLFPAVRQVVANPGGFGPPLRDGLRGVQNHILSVIARNLGVVARGTRDELLDAIEAFVSDETRLPALLASLPGEFQEWYSEIAARADHRLTVRGYDQWHGDRPRTMTEVARSVALIVPDGWDTFSIPREVGLWLRHGRVVTGIGPTAPIVMVDDVDPRAVDSSAGAHAQTLLGHVVALIEEIETRPLAILKAGGVGIREIRRLARRLEVADEEAARLLELTVAADLVGISRAAEAVVPAPAVDEWLLLPPADRWLKLVDAWIETARHLSLAGSESADGKPIPALVGHGAVSARGPRHEVLSGLNLIPAGRAAERESLWALLYWQSPRRHQAMPAGYGMAVRWTLEEAEMIGFTALGAMSTSGRAAYNRDPGATRYAAAMLPPPLDTFTIQADLTAVVPGVLDPVAGAVLADAADKESGGAATVWRFSAASVRRALDHGRTAQELQEFLTAHATHGVPQTLTYLIDDVARRHGHLRVAGAVTVVHGDDPALLAEVVRHRKLVKLGLRMVAPTVLVTTKKAPDAIDALRAAGYLPVGEKADGSIGVTKPPKHRADVTLTTYSTGAREPAAMTEQDLDQLVATLKTPNPPASPEPVDIDLRDLIEVIDEAMEAESPVAFGYRDAKGEERIVVGYPNWVSEYELDATTERGPQTFLLDRIEWAERVDLLGEE